MIKKKIRTTKKLLIDTIIRENFNVNITMKTEKKKDFFYSNLRKKIFYLRILKYITCGDRSERKEIIPLCRFLLKL